MTAATPDETIATAPPPPARTISMVLRGALDHAEGDTLTIRTIVDALGDRALAIVMILFCLPNCVPVPPGVGLVFGFPMLLIALQMVIGRHKPWLPKRLLDRRLKTKDYARMLDLAEPWLKKVEAVLKPRLTVLFSNPADRLIGLFFVLCAFSVILPLPGSNFPPAVASVLIALAMLEEDGIVMIVGLIIGVLGLLYTTLLGGALIYAAWAAIKAAVGL